MAYTLGLNAKIYVNTGTTQTPTWTELDLAMDVTINMEKATTDISTRASNGWRENAGTLKDMTIDTSLRYDVTNAGFQKVKDVFLASGDSVEVVALDGDIQNAGQEGIKFTADVSNFTRNEPLEEALTVDVTFIPVPGAAAPDWVTTPLS